MIQTQKIFNKKLRTLLAAFVAVFLSAAVFVGLIGSPADAWGPQRTTYTWEKPADHPTFNSMTDNPQIGDERYFVRIREAGTTNFVDEIELQPGKEYEVRTWYHNNASSTLNSKENNRAGFAQNVRIHAYMPELIQSGDRLAIKSVISASNTSPTEVWDETYITASHTIALRYMPGTAKLTTEGAANGSVLPVSLFGDTGAFIGYYDTTGDLRGIVPGCEQYVGYVTYRFIADFADFTIEKTVNGKDLLDAKMGDEITFQVKYTNTGTVAQKNVTIGDSLPKGLTYVPNSTTITNALYPNGTKLEDGHLFKEGINIGNYASRATATVTYRAKVGTDLDVCRNYTLINKVSILTENGNKTDSASVKITRDEKHPDCTPEEPEDPEDPEDPEEPKAPPITPPDTGTPPELPKTGPVESIMAIFAILAITIGITYWYRSRTAVKKAVHVSKTVAAEHEAAIATEEEAKEKAHQEQIAKRHKHLPNHKRVRQSHINRNK